MKYKAFVLITFLFAIVFLVSSAVVVETSKDDREDEKNQNQLGRTKQYGCQHGCCRYAGHRCVYCCPAPDSEGDRLTQNQDTSQPEDKNQNQVGSSKIPCQHGCCRYAGYRCIYCCPAPHEEESRLSQNQDKPQPAEESNPMNDEKHGWRGDGHGGGGRGHGGGGRGGGGHGGGGRGGGGHGGRGGRCCGTEKGSNEAKP